MGAVTITRFGGIIPRVSERLLPDNAAQVAVNCRLSSGELVPFRSAVKRYTSAKTGPLQTIFRIEQDGSEAWLTWPCDVDVVRAPLYGKARWCFSGDGEPRITTFADATAGGGDAYPNTAYTLGTPAPHAKPSVAVTGGVGSTVDRYYCYTFYAAWDGVEFEGAVSPISDLVSGKVDGTWTISGMDASPPNGGTVTGVYAAGETEFADTVDHFLRVGEQVVISGNTLTVTAVPTSKKFRVAGNYASATSWARKAPFPGTLYKRLYRSAGTRGNFLLVAEGITGTSYTDTLTDTQIPGDELISASWEMPPTDLKGLIVLPSGALCGFSGNRLFFSEPMQPHAWPPEYQMQAEYDIVGVAHYGSGVLAATTAKPFIVTGVEPGQMSGETRDEVFPCKSKRSVVSLGEAAIYAAPQGLVAANAGGLAVWSQQYFTAVEFSAYDPETMVSAVADRRLYVLYRAGDLKRALVFGLEGDPYLTEIHIIADEMHADATNGRLYYAAGADIYEFDAANGAFMQQDWMSKEIVLPMPKNLGAARIDFEQAIGQAQADAILARAAEIQAANAAAMASGNVRGAWNAMGFNRRWWNGSAIEEVPTVPDVARVNFMLYADGAVKFTKTVGDGKPFRLPSGYKASRFSVRVQSNCIIRSIELGDTPLALRSTGQS